MHRAPMTRFSGPTSSTTKIERLGGTNEDREGSGKERGRKSGLERGYPHPHVD